MLDFKANCLDGYFIKWFEINMFWGIKTLNVFKYIINYITANQIKLMM